MTVSADRGRTLVFIPACNEESALPGVVAEAHDALPDAALLVIDDGSTDATVAVARDARPLQRPRQDSNLGLEDCYLQVFLAWLS